MAAVTLFSFEGSQVRVSIDEKGEPWFVAKDVAEILGYTWNGALAIQHVPEHWKGVRSVLTPGGKQSMPTLSESGLNFFVMRSDKPKALPFQEWLAGEVLPSIRKTGSYSRYTTPPPPPVLSQIAEERATIIEVAAFLQRTIPNMRPELLAACTLRALKAGGLMQAPVMEELRNSVSIDWDKAPSLTPTEIGQKLGGVKPTVVNKMLEVRGLQKKLGKKWEPTEEGMSYAGAVSYQAENSEHKGVQLKWAPEIVEVLQEPVETETPTKSKLLV